jgi:hypothetical protein
MLKVEMLDLMQVVVVARAVVILALRGLVAEELQEVVVHLQRIAEHRHLVVDQIVVGLVED